MPDRTQFAPAKVAAISDARGDVRELRDSTGAAFARYDYDAYGNTTSSQVFATTLITLTQAQEISDAQPLRYAGYVWDAETGLYYCSQRYYDPSTASFISRDPAKADGEKSPYLYCAGEPVGGVDPSGMWVTSIAVHAAAKLLLASANLIYNKRISLPPGLLNGQGLGHLAKMRFGLFSMSYNGCEVIAVYNAMYLLSKKKSLASIAFEFEINGCQWAWGLFGSKPYFLGRYLLFHKVKYSTTTSLKTLEGWKKSGRTFIMSFWNKKGSIAGGIHTVAVKCGSNKKLTVYNKYNNSTSGSSCPNFTKALDGGSLIIGYYVH